LSNRPNQRLDAAQPSSHPVEYASDGGYNSNSSELAREAFELLFTRIGLRRLQCAPGTDDADDRPNILNEAEPAVHECGRYGEVNNTRAEQATKKHDFQFTGEMHGVDGLS
jgi:hypothetical protein